MIHVNKIYMISKHPCDRNVSFKLKKTYMLLLHFQRASFLNTFLFCFVSTNYRINCICENKQFYLEHMFTLNKQVYINMHFPVSKI